MQSMFWMLNNFWLVICGLCTQVFNTEMTCNNWKWLLLILWHLDSIILPRWEQVSAYVEILILILPLMGYPLPWSVSSCKTICLVLLDSWDPVNHGLNFLFLYCISALSIYVPLRSAAKATCVEIKGRSTVAYKHQKPWALHDWSKLQGTGFC